MTLDPEALRRAMELAVGGMGLRSDDYTAEQIAEHLTAAALDSPALSATEGLGGLTAEEAARLVDYADEWEPESDLVNKLRRLAS